MTCWHSPISVEPSVWATGLLQASHASTNVSRSSCISCCDMGILYKCITTALMSLRHHLWSRAALLYMLMLQHYKSQMHLNESDITLFFFFFSIASIIERYKLEQIVEGFTLGKPVLRVGTGSLFYPRCMKLREFPGDVFFCGNSLWPCGIEYLGSGKGLSPVWHQAITLTNEELFSIGHWT